MHIGPVLRIGCDTGGVEMVVMTMKAKVKWAVILALTAVSAVIVAVVVFHGMRGEQWAVVADVKYRLSAGSEQERIDFLGQFGWTVEEEPVEVGEVVIPTEWNDVYTQYNQLQQEQGLDLTKYAGKTCKRWVYRVLNYPREGQEVHATLLIYDGVVVAGDLSSASLDGFMATFLGENGLMRQEETEVSEPAKEADAIPFDAYPTD